MKRFYKLVLLALAAVFGTVSSAQATFQLRYSTNGGGTFTTISDNGPGDSNVLPDAIQSNVDGLTIVGQASTSLATDVSHLELQVTGSTKAAINIVVQATVTGIFTTPPPQDLSFAFTSSLLGAHTGAFVNTGETWVTQSNTPFGMAGGPVDTGAQPTNTAGDIVFTAGVPYSATTSLHLQVTPTSNRVGVGITLDSNNLIIAADTPAPAALLLVVSGTPVLGVWTWFRRRQRQLPAPAPDQQ